MRASNSRRGQQGFVLIVSLLVLLMLGIIATTVARTNRLQLHIAGNDEGRVAALQQALAVLDAVLDSPAAFSLDSGVGHRNCLAGSLDRSCDEYAIELAPGALPEAGRVELSVTRVAPAESAIPLLEQDLASSAVHYRAAKFEVRVAYDGAAAGIGRAALVQGVFVRLPVSMQSGGAMP
jgi:hypothetical protein